MFEFVPPLSIGEVLLLASFGGLLDKSALLAMLLGWYVGGGLFGGVWLGRLEEVGCLVSMALSRGVDLCMVGVMDGRM